MIKIEDIRKYFLERCDEVISLSERGDPWVFLCGAAMIDYLAQMTPGKKMNNYIGFVDEYFYQVNPNYRTFSFGNGKMDLPKQMYYVLRCGIVHSFSLVPDARGIGNGGRSRSILLGHEKNGLSHFQVFDERGMDSVIFTAEQFSKDIKDVVALLFNNANKKPELLAHILLHSSKHPPIIAQF